MFLPPWKAACRHKPKPTWSKPKVAFLQTKTKSASHASSLTMRFWFIFTAIAPLENLFQLVVLPSGTSSILQLFFLVLAEPVAGAIWIKPPTSIKGQCVKSDLIQFLNWKELPLIPGKKRLIKLHTCGTLKVIWLSYPQDLLKYNHIHTKGLAISSLASCTANQRLYRFVRTCPHSSLASSGEGGQAKM